MGGCSVLAVDGARYRGVDDSCLEPIVNVGRVCETALDARLDLDTLGAAAELGWPHPRHMEDSAGRGFMARFSSNFSDATWEPKGLRGSAGVSR